MAAQDETVFDQPDEWRLRDKTAWANSVMFADQVGVSFVRQLSFPFGGKVSPNANSHDAGVH